MIALQPSLQARLAGAVKRHGVTEVRSWLECDEQTMMRAAVGVPLRDDVAKRIALIVDTWEEE